MGEVGEHSREDYPSPDLPSDPIGSCRLSLYTGDDQHSLNIHSSIIA